MVSTYTPNVGFELPARGDYVGTWDTPVNANETLADLIVGGTATISGTAGSVVLSAAQFECKTLIVNSTLLASISLTFPTSFTKSYEIFNACTGSSAFVVTLRTTVSGSQSVCAPPGEICEVANIGGNILFKNLGRIGSYWDYAGSSVPAWVSGCTVPPYLNCDGSTFSGTTYPQLAVICGGTTLPDSRNRVRAALSQGAGRITSGVCGINGASLFAAGGDEQLHQHTHSNVLTDPGHSHGYQNNNGGAALGAGTPGGLASNATTNSALTGITVSINNAGGGTAQNVQPTYIGGLALIRAG